MKTLRLSSELAKKSHVNNLSRESILTRAYNTAESISRELIYRLQLSRVPRSRWRGDSRHDRVSDSCLYTHTTIRARSNSADSQKIHIGPRHEKEYKVDAPSSATWCWMKKKKKRKCNQERKRTRRWLDSWHARNTHLHSSRVLRRLQTRRSPTAVQPSLFSESYK